MDYRKRRSSILKPPRLTINDNCENEATEKSCAVTTTTTTTNTARLTKRVSFSATQQVAEFLRDDMWSSGSDHSNTTTAPSGIVSNSTREVLSSLPQGTYDAHITQRTTTTQMDITFSQPNPTSAPIETVHCEAVVMNDDIEITECFDQPVIVGDGIAAAAGNISRESSAAGESFFAEVDDVERGGASFFPDDQMEVTFAVDKHQQPIVDTKLTLQPNQAQVCFQPTLAVPPPSVDVKPEAAVDKLRVNNLPDNPGVIEVIGDTRVNTTQSKLPTPPGGLSPIKGGTEPVNALNVSEFAARFSMNNASFVGPAPFHSTMIIPTAAVDEVDEVAVDSNEKKPAFVNAIDKENQSPNDIILRGETSLTKEVTTTCVVDRPVVCIEEAKANPPMVAPLLNKTTCETDNMSGIEENFGLPTVVDPNKTCHDKSIFLCLSDLSQTMEQDEDDVDVVCEKSSNNIAPPNYRENTNVVGVDQQQNDVKGGVSAKNVDANNRPMVNNIVSSSQEAAVAVGVTVSEASMILETSAASFPPPVDEKETQQAVKSTLKNLANKIGVSLYLSSNSSLSATEAPPKAINVKESIRRGPRSADIYGLKSMASVVKKNQQLSFPKVCSTQEPIETANEKSPSSVTVEAGQDVFTVANTSNKPTFEQASYRNANILGKTRCTMPLSADDSLLRDITPLPLSDESFTTPPYQKSTQVPVSSETFCVKEGTDMVTEPSHLSNPVVMSETIGGGYQSGIMPPQTEPSLLAFQDSLHVEDLPDLINSFSLTEGFPPAPTLPTDVSLTENEDKENAEKDGCHINKGAPPTVEEMEIQTPLKGRLRSGNKHLLNSATKSPMVVTKKRAKPNTPGTASKALVETKASVEKRQVFTEPRPHKTATSARRNLENRRVNAFTVIPEVTLPPEPTLLFEETSSSSNLQKSCLFSANDYAKILEEFELSTPSWDAVSVEPVLKPRLPPSVQPPIVSSTLDCHSIADEFKDLDAALGLLEAKLQREQEEHRQWEALEEKLEFLLNYLPVDVRKTIYFALSDCPKEVVDKRCRYLDGTKAIFGFLTDTVTLTAVLGDNVPINLAGKEKFMIADYRIDVSETSCPVHKQIQEYFVAKLKSKDLLRNFPSTTELGMMLLQLNTIHNHTCDLWFEFVKIFIRFNIQFEEDMFRVQVTVPSYLSVFYLCFKKDFDRLFLEAPELISIVFDSQYPNQLSENYIRGQWKCLTQDSLSARLIKLKEVLQRRC